MGFITCNQRTDFLSLTKQATFTPFAMDSIIGKVNINALLLQNKEVCININRVSAKVSGQYFGKLVV